MQFSRLDEVRSVAKARSQEDFEYFANCVLGLRLDHLLCKAVQDYVEKEPASQLRLDKKTEEALNAWLVVLGRVPYSEIRCPSETFQWLFGRAA